MPLLAKPMIVLDGHAGDSIGGTGWRAINRLIDTEALQTFGVCDVAIPPSRRLRRIGESWAR